MMNVPGCLFIYFIPVGKDGACVCVGVGVCVCARTCCRAQDVLEHLTQCILPTE